MDIFVHMARLRRRQYMLEGKKAISLGKNAFFVFLLARSRELKQKIICDGMVKLYAFTIIVSRR